MDSQLASLRGAIESAIRGMSSEELSRHAQGKWSAAEVLEHLYLTYTGTVKGFERCLEAERPLASSPSLWQRAATMLVVGLGYLPGGRQAPANTRPKGIPAQKVVSDILFEIDLMDELIGKCEARYGSRTRLLDHPVLGPLTATQWRKFHCVHGQHHVKQIQRLRVEQRGAPGSGRGFGR